MTVIRIAKSSLDFEAFCNLVREYVDWCRERFADEEWVADAAFGRQALEDALTKLQLV